MDYKHGRNTVYLINYHLIWCPKRRKKVLVGKVKQRLKQITKEVCKENGIEILEFVINPDHLHLFVSAEPSISPYKIVKRIKGRSSRFLRKEFPHLLKLPSLWTHSYFVSTAGDISSELIKKYIEQQIRFR